VLQYFTAWTVIQNADDLMFCPLDASGAGRDEVVHLQTEAAAPGDENM
jgi:hypothetical protein